jgi:hypothetical protein
MLKLSRIRNASKTASWDVFSGLAEAVKAAARMNRDGGVKSPGSPANPEPPPRGESFNPSRVMAARGAGERPMWLRRLVRCQE